MLAALSRLTQRAISRYVTLSSRFPFWILGALALLTAALSAGLPRITLQTRVEALLPKDTVSQRSNDEAIRRYAGSAPFFLVVQSSDAALNRSMTEQALSHVEKWPETIWAIDARDPRPFLDRRLLFVDEDALEAFTDDVKRYVEFRKCEKMPGCFQLDDEPPQPSFDKLQQQLKSQPEVSSLSALFGEHSLDEAVESSSGAAGTGALCSKSGHVCVVQVALDREPTDLAFARGMVKKGEALLEDLKPAHAPADMVLAVEGIYRNLPLAQHRLMNDLKGSFAFGVLMMIGVIMLQFRRVRAILLLLVPLAFGSVWALGVFAWISPDLNMISAAGFIILAGLGIDFGLHLLTHYGAERELGHCPRDSVKHTLEELVPSLSLAALTTAFGFMALTAAKFQGFAQLGAFATIGIFATLAASLLTFPPLVLGLQQLRPREGAFTRPWPMPAFLKRGFSVGPARLITLMGMAAFAASVVLLPSIRLREDLTPLIDDGVRAGTDFREALPGTSRGAVMLLADDRPSLEQAASSIRNIYPNGLSGPEVNEGSLEGRVTGAPVITLGTFLPPQQEQKLAHIQELSDAAEDAMRFGDDEWKEKLRPWLPLLEVTEPLQEDNLPSWVLQSLRERDGTLGTVGLTYQDYPGSHAGKMQVLTEKLDVLRQKNKNVRFAASSATLGEVMPLLREDGWKVTSLALVGQVIATLLIGRSRRRTILILSSILLAVAATAAFMAVLDWRIDFYNMLIFPVAFGMGVDGAIYVVWSVLGRKGKFDWTDLPVSARAVFGSTVTTLVMFLSLCTSDNGGLRSLGYVGSVALFITLLSNLLWLPAALSWLQKVGEPRGIRTDKNTLAGESAG